VNDENAHPHGNEYFSVVHNGIIENGNKLRDNLKSLGHIFHSQTDSECFLVQLTHEYEQSKDIGTAIQKAFSMMEGNSAFVIMMKGSNKLYAIKNSAPLVCGVNKDTGDVFMSSDPYALVGFTTKIYFPEDKVLCIADPSEVSSEIQFFELDGKSSKRFSLQEKQMDLQVVSKGKYEHFMLKEIFEQPELIRRIFSIYSSGKNLDKLVALKNEKKPSYVHLIGCGTAYHAGMLIKNFLEQRNKIRVQTEFASEFRYRRPIINDDEVGLFISQSGETADTLACQQLCTEKKLKTYSIVNVEGSTLYRDSTENFLLYAGVEIGVASTKAFTQQVIVGYLISKALEGALEDGNTKVELEAIAKAIDAILLRENEIKEIAKEIHGYKGFIFTGRGDQYPIALEGALKLKEIAYVHAEGYASGELKHGPIALFDENMVNIAIVTPDLYEKTLSNAEEVKARKGVMVIIGDSGNKDLREMSDYFFGIDFSGLGELKPVATNIVLQLLSYHIASFKGTDIDKPRNLAKSVTVE
jgi:glucosamine--fructose-6-phosphate aminotransferase (isomerizing)